MKTMMIFERLVSLHRERHRHVRVDFSRVDHAFAAATNSVPLAMEEVLDAALHHPCVFIERNGQYSLAALLGLRAHQNLSVGPDGRWLPHHYVPAHVRRYPFALAETEQPDNFLICLDEACAGLQPDEGQPLFEADGSEAALLADARTFLLNLHNAFATSQTWCQEVHALGLLTPRALSWVDAQGDTQELTGFFAIDEQALRDLPAEVLQRWNAAGLMAVAWAHVLSMGHVRTLAARQVQADALAASAPAAPSAPIDDAPTETPEVTA